MSKQVIVLRKDLNMRKGKMVAQGAHASMKVFFDRINDLDKRNGFDKGYPFVTIDITKEMHEWMCGAFTKVCVGVNSEQELLDIYNKACAAKIPCSLIRDAGKTEFNGVPTLTAVAVGPHSEKEIDAITGELSLL